MTAPIFKLQGEIKASAETLLADFLEGNPGEVTLTINSPGGDAMAGAAMMAAVERHGAVTTVVRGVAASAATLPMVASHAVIIHAAALVMIHEPSAMTGGTADLFDPRFDGALLSLEWKEALWDKFVTEAPRPRTLSEQQYSDRKLRSRS